MPMTLCHLLVKFCIVAKNRKLLQPQTFRQAASIGTVHKCKLTVHM